MRAEIQRAGEKKNRVKMTSPEIRLNHNRKVIDGQVNLAPKAYSKEYCQIVTHVCNNNSSNNNNNDDDDDDNDNDNNRGKKVNI